MERTKARLVILAGALALVLASCGGDAAPTTTTAPTSTTTTTAPPTTTTTAPAPTTTVTTVPAGPPLAVEGDRNEIVEALQFLLNCNGFGGLTVDGAFGPATRAAVEAAQQDLGRTVNGEPDEETFATLARTCGEGRDLEGEGEVTVVGNAAPEDPEVFSIPLLGGTVLTVSVTRGTGVAVTLTGADGVEVAPESAGQWAIEATQDYVLRVDAADEAVTFALVVKVAEATRPVGDWILSTDGISYKGAKLALGSDAQTVLDKVFQSLGHGVRGAYDEFDTGWYTITEPADMGLRGVFIEGFALLFFGPDPNNPDRPETFRRHRFVGPTVDAAGNPRPDNYATTAQGITVGDTLADLKAVYGDRALGSNDEEYYYRLADAGGVLCFYFDTEDAPDDYSPIVEIASECRTD